MMETSTVSMLGNLVLVRLLVPSPKGPPRSEIKRNLKPYLPDRGTSTADNTLLDETLDTLAAGGLITRKPIGLTQEGRRQALDFLGLEAAPPRLTWRLLRDTYLVARALQVRASSSEVSKQLADSDRLRALILKKEYALPLGESPTLAQALNALAWKQLGVASTHPFDLKAVIKQVLSLPHALSVEQLKKQLPARATGARTSKPEELRLAILRAWLTPARPIEAERDGMASLAGEVVVNAQREDSFNLRGFAEGVLEAAHSSPTGRCGDDKVFISHVWRKLQEDRAFPARDVVEFKQHLTEANREGFLTLSRADRLEALDPADVHASETHALNATFHFVQV